ncbi:MAG TPA: hypothetical protein VHO84_10815, partial [Syntrophorhabdaceae bacterium]|nr:hypothetical protein [Syntrophorhabdaceae bacterium]
PHPMKTVSATLLLSETIAHMEQDIAMTKERLDAICGDRVRREAMEERYGRGALEDNRRQLLHGRRIWKGSKRCSMRRWQPRGRWRPTSWRTGRDPRRPRMTGNGEQK